MKQIDTLDVQLCINPSVAVLIKNKLYCNDTTRYGIGGVYYGHHIIQPVGFEYICRGYYLIVKLSHEFMVGIETSSELQEKVIQLVVDYFHISRDDIIIQATVMLDKLCISRKVIRNTVSKKKYIKVKQVGWMIKSRIKMTRKFRQEIQSYRKNKKKKIRLCLGSISNQTDLVEINRCEYKNDYKMKVADEQLVAQDIFRITADKAGRLVKELSVYKNRTNCEYKTKKNNSIAITLYFKEYERLEAGDVAGAEKYKNFLRTEVKLKNKHLDNNRKKMDKTLANYFSPAVAEGYFNKYLVPIFGKNPYWRLDIAQLEIYKNELLQDFEKDRLYKFLENINKYGISEVKEMYDSDTFREYTKKIRKMNMNILCFSPVIHGKKITIKKMENFTLLQSGISKDI